jgi:hypothetical protein
LLYAVLLRRTSSRRRTIASMSPNCGFSRLETSGALAEARTTWEDSIRGMISATEAEILRIWIYAGNLRFLRTLIRESKLDGELLPLVVAMDYLETGDRSPLEKLSAEIRPIAEEIVAELQKNLPATAEPSMHTAHA